MKRETFTLSEVEALVKYTYEVGFCDGVDGDGSYSPNADSFWNEHIDDWLTEEIKYTLER